MTQEEIRILIQQLEQSGQENHTELLKLLGKMENNMSESSSENLSQILQTIDEMRKNYDMSVQVLKSEMNENLLIWISVSVRRLAV